MNQTPVFPVPLLERVREGMTVIDDSGRQLGTVAHIRMGDPQAVTTEGEDTLSSDAAVVAAPAASPGGTSAFGAAVPFAVQGLAGLDLPDQLQRELLRTGFVEVDGHELEGTERFVAGDRITDVSADTVRVRRVIPSTSTASRFARLRSAAVKPVVRTYLGASHEPRGPLPMPLLIGLGAAVALVSAAGGVWLVYRRRQAEREPIHRLRRSAAAVEELVDRPSTTTAGIGAALLLALIIVRSLKRGRSEENRPTRASATITIALPRWRARA